MNAITTQDQPRLPAMPSGGAVKAIVPQDFEGAWRIANAVVIAGMAPKGLDTPEKAMVAIMHGLEVGMTPMAALQSIAVINSRATIWGDGALGLVQASGKMESHKEWFEGAGDTRKAFCTVVRKGDPEPKHGEFSVADAKAAKLLGKPGPWQEYRDRMLKMRARAFALRDGFSDVLKGLGIAEEVQDVQMVRDSAPVPPVPPRPPVPPSAQIAGPAETIDNETGEITVDATAQSIDADQDETVDDCMIDDNQFFTDMNDAMAVAGDAATIEEIWTSADPLARFQAGPAAETNQGISMAIKNKHLNRVGSSK